MIGRVPEVAILLYQCWYHKSWTVILLFST